MTTFASDRYYYSQQKPSPRSSAFPITKRKISEDKYFRTATIVERDGAFIPSLENPEANRYKERFFVYKKGVVLIGALPTIVDKFKPNMGDITIFGDDSKLVFKIAKSLELPR